MMPLRDKLLTSIMNANKDCPDGGNGVEETLHHCDAWRL